MSQVEETTRLTNVRAHEKQPARCCHPGGDGHSVVDPAGKDRQTAQQGTVFDTILVEARQKGSALQLTCR
eukprot:SAG22_NODE_10442_length_535_cov_1.110092_1_plen_69_part_10